MKKFLILIVSIASFTAFGAPANSNPKETIFKSVEGVTMGLKLETSTYAANNDSGGGNAYSFSLSASSAHITSTSKVRAILTDTCTWSIARQSFQNGLQADMKQKQTTDGSVVFSADFTGSLPTNYAVHGGDSYTCTADFSVVVDGIWQTDPVNGSHNFNFNFFSPTKDL
jgi:hypothetical protein